jgi:hypothetical protein
VKLWLERIYPHIIGAGTAALVYDAHLFAIALPQGENLLAAVVSLGGIFAGFLATIKTLLLGANEKTLDRLRRSGYIAELKRYLSEGIWSAILLCVVAIVGFSKSLVDDFRFLCVLFGVLAFCLAALFRITRIGMALLTAK